MMDDYNLEIQRELDAHERIMVGVNKFVPDEEHAPTRFTFDPTNTRMHIRRFAELKQQRDAGPWSQSLRTLYRTARDGNNPLQAMIDAFIAAASRSDERRVGHDSVRTCSSGWSTMH